MLQPQSAYSLLTGPAQADRPANGSEYLRYYKKKARLMAAVEQVPDR